MSGIADDKFWLEYGKSSIEKSITKTNEAAQKLEKMTLWFWGVYTTAFAIGTTLQLLDATRGVLFLMASPIFLLILTYWLCVNAQMPVNSGGFNPLIPSDIRKSYILSVRKKRWRHIWALISTLFSAILLGLALLLYTLTDKKAEYNLDVSYNKTQSRIVVSGLFPKNKELTIVVDSVGDGNNQVEIYQNHFIIQENGLLNLNVPIELKVRKELRVSCYWIDSNKKKKGLVRFVEVKK